MVTLAAHGCPKLAIISPLARPENSPFGATRQIQTNHFRRPATPNLPRHHVADRTAASAVSRWSAAAAIPPPTPCTSTFGVDSMKKSPRRRLARSRGYVHMLTVYGAIAAAECWLNRLHRRSVVLTERLDGAFRRRRAI